MMHWRMFLAMLLITALAGGLSGWAGIEYGLQRAAAHDDLDTVLHRDLNLTSEQERQIAHLESTFAKDRSGFQNQMRGANKELAHALTEPNPNGPEIERAVHSFHTAMAALQVRTVKHVLSMRSVLTAEQTKIFDTTVSKTLGAERS